MSTRLPPAFTELITLLSTEIVDNLEKIKVILHDKNQFLQQTLASLNPLSTAAMAAGLGMDLNVATAAPATPNVM